MVTSKQQFLLPPKQAVSSSTDILSAQLLLPELTILPMQVPYHSTFKVHSSMTNHLDPTRVIHKLEESNHQVWFSSKHTSHHKITAVEPYIFSCCAVWTHWKLWAIPTRFQSAFNDYPCSHLHPLPRLKCPLAHFSNLLRI